MSESLAHLKLSAMRDFINILKSEGIYDEKNHNKTDNIFYFGDGFVEFFSAENSGKVHGARRDVLYINECNNVNYETFFQASSRTKVVTLLDYNPVESFWVMEQLIPMLDGKDYELIKSTVVDNQFIPQKSLQDILRRSKVDENYKRVYLLGEVGNLDGLIFPTITLIDEMPKEGKRSIGVDFGFTNDPTAIIDTVKNGKGLFLDELLYKTGQLGSDLVTFLKSKSLPTNIDVWCDHSPEMIEQLYRGGINAKKADKGTIREGLDLMIQQPIFVTKRSTNLIKEFRNYQWKVDKNGTRLNEPIDAWCHGIDAARYGSKPLLVNKEIKKARFVVPKQN